MSLKYLISKLCSKDVHKHFEALCDLLNVVSKGWWEIIDEINTYVLDRFGVDIPFRWHEVGVIQSLLVVVWVQIQNLISDRLWADIGLTNLQHVFCS